ncbi:MAG: S8 family serine peptidase [Lachnospiraceae bacterium]|nr:S8 family serine peptidase [Lachnospiraceae bacterium]
MSTSKEKQVSDGVFVVKVSKNDIDRLRKDRDVTEVERDLEIYALGDYKLSDLLGGTWENNSWAYDLVRVNELNTEIMKGQGLRIAVLDTAVNTEYVEVTDSVSFVSDKDSVSSDILHGTYVANIVKKTLPDAEIFSAAILDKNGKGYYSTLIAGLKWAVRNKADIIVMSLGGEGYSNILREEILNAYYNDILLFSAAGNTDHILYPAAYNETIAVGCLNRDSSVTFSYKDVNGKKIYADVYAPGEVYGINGTSGAAAFAAACAGILLNYDEHLSFEQVKALYINTGKANNREYSVLDVYSSVIYSRNPIYTRLSYADRTFSEIQEAEDEIDWDIVEQMRCYHSAKEMHEVVGPHTSIGHEVYRVCKCGQVRLLASDHAKIEGCKLCFPPATPTPTPTPKPNNTPTPEPEPEPCKHPRWTRSNYSEDEHVSGTYGQNSKHSYTFTKTCKECHTSVECEETVECSFSLVPDSSGIYCYQCTGCGYSYYPVRSLSYSVSPLGAGRISGTSQGTYNAGQNFTLTAEANSGYDFVRWEYAGRNVSNRSVSGTLNLSNVSLTAVFEKKKASSNKTNQDSSKGSKATNQEMVGEPVNVITGNFYDECDDMILNNVGDVRLTLSRSYNSMDAENGLLGRGWHMNLETSLTVKNVSENEDTVIVKYADGRSMRFRKTVDGKAADYDDFYAVKQPAFVYVSPDKCNDILYKATDGSFVLVTNARISYVYEAGKLKKIIDKNGNDLSLVYSGDTLQNVTSSDGRSITFQISSGKIVKATDHTGRYVTYKYTDGNLTEVSGDCVPKQTYTYNEYGLESVIDANGKTGITNTYDCNGRVIYQIDSEGKETRFKYNDEERENSFILVESGAVTRYQYDDNLYITRINYADGSFAEYSYDENGNRIGARDRNGYTSSYEYDVRGNLTKVTNSLGSTASFTYSASGDVLSTTDSRGAETRFVYDAKGNIVEKHEQVDERSFSVTKYTYDDKGRVTGIIDALGNKTAYTYSSESANSAKSVTDALGNTVTNEYDSLSRLISTGEGKARTTISYDRQGNVTSVTDPLGNTELFIYDAAGRVVKVIRPEQAKNLKKTDGLSLSDVKDIPGYTYEYDGMGRLTGAKDPLGNKTGLTYDINNNITKATVTQKENMSFSDDKGYTYSYDMVGNLIKVGAPDGGSTHLFYDAKGNLTRSVDPNGNETSYAYDPADRLIRVTDDDKNVIAAYEYDRSGNVVKYMNSEDWASGSSDEERTGTLFKYDLSGNRTEVRVPVKEENGKVYYRLVRYSFDALGRKTAEMNCLEPVVKDADGGEWFVVNYVYDKTGRLTEVEASDGSFIRYGYNSRGNRTTEDVNGTVTEFSYDEADRMISVTNPYGGLTSYTYDGNGKKVSITLPEGEKTGYKYDVCDNLLQKTEIVTPGKGSRETFYEYDAYKNVTKITDPLGNVTTYTYDENNRLKTVTDALSNVASFTYDKNGNNTSVTDALGNTTTYIYDNRDCLVKTVNAKDDECMTYSYDPAGKLVSKKDAVGVTTGYTYDRAGNVLSVSVYDNNTSGSVTKKAKKKGTGSVSTEEYKYDVLGHLIEYTDPLGNRTLYENDFWGNVTKVTDALGNVTEYTYDKNGLILTIADANGAQTAFSYDDAGMLLKITYPDDNVLTYTRDKEGRVVTRTDRNGVVLSTEYDSFGNLTRKEYNSPSQNKRAVGDRETYSYTYDALNRVASVEKEVVTAGYEAVTDVVQYSYDVLGRMIGKTESGLNDSDISLSYDAIGNVTRIQNTSALGRTYDVSYAYDVIGNLVSVTDNIASDSISMTYFADGTLKTKSIAGRDRKEVTSSYSYDALKNIISLRTESDGTVFYFEDNIFDPAGNLIGQNTDGTYAGYDYDALNRLIRETYSFADDPSDGLEISYTYDALGNRTSKEDSKNGRTSYTYDILNRLLTEETAWEDTFYYYDANGNVVEKCVEQAKREEEKVVKRSSVSAGSDYIYRYSLSGLMTLVTKDGERVQENLYGAENLRKVRSVWDDFSERKENYTVLSGKVIESTNLTTLLNVKGEAETTSQRSIVYGNGLEKIGNETVITSSHGDVKKLIGAVGEVVAEYIYDAFGNLIYDCAYTEDFTNDLLYAGEQHDAVTDTYYLRARTYAPSIGRFLEEDPYLGDGRNLYSYVSNNPLRYVDPSGYCKKDSGWSLSNVIKWGIRGAKTVAGVAMIATGAGAGVGTALLVSVAIDITSEIIVDTAVEIAEQLGADEKTKAIVGDLAQIGVGAAAILTGVGAPEGYALIGSGAGGLVGGYIGEKGYELITGEKSEEAFLIGSGVGNAIGSFAGDKIGSKLASQADDALKVTTKTYDKFADTADDVGKAPVTPGFDDWLNKGNADNKVYFGIIDGEPKYTGITKQTLDARLSQHNANGKGFQQLDEQFANLTRNQARAVEQYYIENGPNELNKINSIGENNKYYQDAIRWAEEFLEGKK